jgi:cell wall assembly regulator SMI1
MNTEAEIAKGCATLVRKWGAEPWNMYVGAARLWEQPSLDELLARLSRALMERFPSVVLRPGLLPSSIGLLERKLMRPLPQELRALWAHADGQERGALYWKYQLVSAAKALRDPQRVSLPFLDDGAGDEIAVDVSGRYGPEGSVIYFDHERPQVVKILYDSVTQWLECLVDGIESGLFVEWEGGLYPGSFVRTGSLYEIVQHDSKRTNCEFPWERKADVVAR